MTVLVKSRDGGTCLRAGCVCRTAGPWRSGLILLLSTSAGPTQVRQFALLITARSIGRPNSRLFAGGNLEGLPSRTGDARIRAADLHWSVPAWHRAQDACLRRRSAGTRHVEETVSSSSRRDRSWQACRISDGPTGTGDLLDNISGGRLGEGLACRYPGCRLLVSTDSRLA